jgi:Protein of unknown function (DUF2939)
MKLMGLVRAIEARDISTVVRYVNFDRVRASLTEQIASAYMRRSDRRPSHQKAGFARSALELLAVGSPIAVVPVPATAWHSSA